MASWRDKYIDLMAGVPRVADHYIALRKSAALGHLRTDARDRTLFAVCAKTAKHGLPRIASVLVCFEFDLHFDGFGRERQDRLKS
jgi:hypothetical protein